MSELGLTDGLAFSASVDQAAARLLAGPEGKRTLGDVARDLERLQASGLSIDEESVLPVAREMLAAGFLDRR